MAARYQLTAERFPVGNSGARDDTYRGDGSIKTGVGWKSSETGDGRPLSGDVSTSARWNGYYNAQQTAMIDGAGCWGDGPPRQSVDHPAGGGGLLTSGNDDVGGLERLAADSAVGRLVLMIQRLTGTNQRLSPATSHLYQATSPRPPMTPSGDVTSSRDRPRYPCHVCSYVGKSLSPFVCLL